MSGITTGNRQELSRRDLLRRAFEAAAGVALAAVLPGCGERKPHSESSASSRNEISLERAQLVILSYMANPRFVGERFTQLITGTDAKLELLDLSKPGYAYFSIPFGRRSSEEAVTHGSATLAQIAIDGKAVWGEQKNGRIELGDIVFRPKKPSFLFRIPTKNFKIELDREVSVPFDNYTYTVTVSELIAFIENRSIFGGLLRLETGETHFGKKVVVSNHGAMVARKEPSLTRLTDAITGAISDREARIQAITDFVTQQISYSRKEAIDSVETLKRPNEVLMSRTSDCSGMTILLASLLEQLDEDYFLLYTSSRTDDGHIAVAIRQGNFAAQNGELLSIGDKNYVLIEATARGFQIGQSVLLSGRGMQTVTHIQKVGQDRLIRLSR